MSVKNFKPLLEKAHLSGELSGQLGIEAEERFEALVKACQDETFGPRDRALFVLGYVAARLEEV